LFNVDLLVMMLPLDLESKEKKHTREKFVARWKRSSRGRTSARSYDIDGVQEYLKSFTLYNMISTAHKSNSLTIR
jgi:hypothetical protein